MKVIHDLEKGGLVKRYVCKESRPSVTFVVLVVTPHAGCGVGRWASSLLTSLLVSLGPEWQDAKWWLGDPQRLSSWAGWAD